LNALSQTHWVARACFVLSLTFALMAVYYATTQQRTLGRLLKAKDVRLWIRGGNRQSEAARLVPSINDIITGVRCNRRSSRSQDSEQALFRTIQFLNHWPTVRPIGQRNRMPDGSNRLFHRPYGPAPYKIIKLQ
jgi:hypothetical protein